MGTGTDEALNFIFHVDDAIIAAKREAVLLKFLKAIQESLDVKITDVNHFLNITIDYDREKNTLHLSQEGAITKALQECGFNDIAHKASPMPPGQKLSKATDQNVFTDSKRIKLFQKQVGCLIYISVAVRKDILYAVQQCCRHMARPNQDHARAVMHIYAYLAGTRTMGITYRKTPGTTPNQLSVYSDASLGTPESEAKSQLAFLTMLNNGIISVHSVTETVTSLSSMEAELTALAGAVQDTLFNRDVLSAMGHEQLGPTRIACDNQPALDSIYNGNFSPQTKHISARFHFVKDYTRNQIVHPVKYPTETLCVDSLTKATPANRFVRDRDFYMGTAPNTLAAP